MSYFEKVVLSKDNSYLPDEDMWEEADLVSKFNTVITVQEDGNEDPRRRHDREEIRRRLAMSSEQEWAGRTRGRSRKPSLHQRLHSGMNLQICFMNETASDGESPEDSAGEEERERGINNNNNNNNTQHQHNTANKGLVRPSTLSLSSGGGPGALGGSVGTAADFLQCQARLQAEARMALAQAKQMAHMQMELDRQKLRSSPITEMLRSSLHKAGVSLVGERRRVSRQMLTDINVGQLQVIVNELHTQIEFLNERLVQLLIARDELHMGQDSMLVDIEDLTRHLGAKGISCRDVWGSSETEPPPQPSSLNTSRSLPLCAP